MDSDSLLPPRTVKSACLNFSLYSSETKAQVCADDFDHWCFSFWPLMSLERLGHHQGPCLCVFHACQRKVFSFSCFLANSLSCPSIMQYYAEGSNCVYFTSLHCNYFRLILKDALRVSDFSRSTCHSRQHEHALEVRGMIQHCGPLHLLSLNKILQPLNARV